MQILWDFMWGTFLTLGIAILMPLGVACIAKWVTGDEERESLKRYPWTYWED